MIMVLTFLWIHRFRKRYWWMVFLSDHVSMVKEPTYENLVSLAATYSDGLIQGSANLPDPVSEVLKETGKPYPGLCEW